jgi:hypothetical protein
MDTFSDVVAAPLVVWIIYRQFAGRFVTPGRSPALPFIGVLDRGADPTRCALIIGAACGDRAACSAPLW